MSDLKIEQPVKSGVGGWLLLFCIALTIASPLLSLYNFMKSYNELATLFDVYPGIKNVLYIDGFLSAVVMILSIRAGIALWTLKKNAVKIAKNYLYIFMGYSVIAIFLPFMAGLPPEVNSAMIPEVIKDLVRAVVYFAIWHTYLNKSTRVKATYYSEMPETEANNEISNFN